MKWYLVVIFPYLVNNKQTSLQTNIIYIKSQEFELIQKYRPREQKLKQ